ncbi:hypothetical protein Tco_0897222 [Tanacetum coccineum]
MDSILEDSVGNLADPNNDLSDNDDVYDDPFDLKEDKIKESKLLIDELDPPRSIDFLPSSKFNFFDATPDKNVKKISISNASLILEDFNPPLYELPFHKEVLGSETLLSFSSKNEKKVFNLGILTSKGVYTSLLPELSHRGTKDCLDFEASRARGFVLRSLELQSSASLWESNIQSYRLMKWISSKKTENQDKNDKMSIDGKRLFACIIYLFNSDVLRCKNQ